MYNLNINKEKNRIYIFIKNKINKEEMESYIIDLKNLIDCTEKDFTVCADLRDCHTSILKDNSSFNPIREYGLKKGLKSAVKIMTREQKDLYRSEISEDLTNIFETKEEAENFLENTICNIN